MTTGKPISYKMAVHKMNCILRPYVTDDVFTSRMTAQEKKDWKRYPFRKILGLEGIMNKYGAPFTPEGRSSIVLNILLKLRGEDYMNQVQPSESYTQEIRDRTSALLKEKDARKAIIEAAKEKGSFAFLTLEEVQIDMDTVYIKTVNKFNEELSKPDPDFDLILKLGKFIQSCVKDKTQMQQFMMLYDLKKGEQKKDAKTWIPASTQTDTDEPRQELRLD